MRGLKRRLVDPLFEEVDGASLAFFRVAFGFAAPAALSVLIMLGVAWRLATALFFLAFTYGGGAWLAGALCC